VCFLDKVSCNWNDEHQVLLNTSLNNVIIVVKLIKLIANQVMLFPSKKSAISRLIAPALVETRFAEGMFGYS
jgi:hypothetical protein